MLKLLISKSFSGHFRAFNYLRMICLLTLCFFSFKGFAASPLSAEVDRQTITTEETLRLTLRHNGQGSVPNPNFSGLEADFEILNQSQNNQFRSFNGQVEAWTEWILVLAPKREGKLIIPAITLKKDSTQPINITVNPPEPLANNGTGKNIFIEAQLNVEKAYVQQQVLFTIRFHTALDVANINPEDPDLDNVKWEEVSEKQYQRRINQKDYRVVEVVYAIYPQHSGELSIPSLRWDVTIGRRSSLFDFGQNGMNTRRRLRTEPLSLKVLPKPASFPKGATWLPAANISLSEAWPKANGRFTQGDPISRTLILEAKGLTASQLPNLSPEYPSAINAYPEPLKKDESKGRYGINTRIEQNQALVSTEAGHFTLPKVEIPWWNVKEDRLEIAKLPAKKLLINAPQGGAIIPAEPTNSDTTAKNTNPETSQDEELTSASAASQTPSSESTPPWWLYLTNGLTLLLALAFGVMLWFQKDKSSASNKKDKASSNLFSKRPEVQAVIDACQAKDPQQTYENLRVWTLQAASPRDKRVRNIIGQLSEMLPDARDALSRLDRHLFGAGVNMKVAAPTEEDFNTIANMVKTYKPEKKHSKNEPLAPLNPV